MTAADALWQLRGLEQVLAEVIECFGWIRVDPPVRLKHPDRDAL